MSPFNAEDVDADEQQIASEYSKHTHTLSVDGQPDTQDQRTRPAMSSLSMLDSTIQPSNEKKGSRISCN